MAKIISIHSIQNGTGKSHITANIAAILAGIGYQVAVIDADTVAPSLYSIFGVEINQASLNDFLWGKCTLKEAVYDISDRIQEDLKGRLWIIPFVATADEINYDISLLSDSFDLINTTFNLDFLIIDMKPGFTPTTLPSLAFSDIEVLILRPEERDYQDTSVSIDIANELGIPDMLLIVNQVPEAFDRESVRSQIEAVYKCDVIAVLPFDSNLAQLPPGNLFVLYESDHIIVQELTRAAAILSV